MFEAVAGKTPAVLLVNPKYEHNVGAALRACSCFGIEQLWWTGDRVTLNGKGERLPREERMKGYRSVTCCRSPRPFDYFDGQFVPIAVEVREHSECLTFFDHPNDALYVFGPEDGSIPKPWLHHCHRFVHIPSHHCLNLAAAVNVVLAHRRIHRQLAGREPVLPLTEMLREHRGFIDRLERDTPALDEIGWDGK